MNSVLYISPPLSEELKGWKSLVRLEAPGQMVESREGGQLVPPVLPKPAGDRIYGTFAGPIVQCASLHSGICADRIGFSLLHHIKALILVNLMFL